MNDITKFLEHEITDNVALGTYPVLPYDKYNIDYNKRYRKKDYNCDAPIFDAFDGEYCSWVWILDQFEVVIYDQAQLNIDPGLIHSYNEFGQHYVYHNDD